MCRFSRKTDRQAGENGKGGRCHSHGGATDLYSSWPLSRNLKFGVEHPTSATEMSSYELWCYIKGTSSPFIVDAECILSIGRLREEIKNERSDVLREVDAASLTLWKVRSF